MAKYVRTKEKIFEITKFTNKYKVETEIKIVNDEVHEIQTKASWGGGKYIQIYSLIKESDNIEDLCDCLVETCISGNRVHDIAIIKTCSFKAEFKRVTNIDFNKNIKVFYGAIWTDKGLIYVAKMNKDGELELI